MEIKLSFKLIIKKVWVFIMLFLILFSSGNVLQTMGPISIYSTFILVGICLGIGILKLKKIKKDCRVLAGIIFFIMVIQTCIIKERGNFTSYLIYIFLILIAYVISEEISFEQFAHYFVNFMVVITVIALIGYYLSNYTAFTHSWKEQISLNDVVYKGNWLFCYIQSIPERNCATFWEPGLFATYLIWAIMADILLLKPKRVTQIARFILFSLGIFSAHSTAGYSLWFATIILLVVYRNEKIGIVKSTWKMVISSIVLVTVIVCVLNLDTILVVSGLINDPFFSKLTSQALASQSRVLALSHNMKYFFENFILGQGITRAYATAKYVCDTSTSTFMMNIFGYLGIFYTIFWIWGVVRQKSINMYTKLIVILIVLSILNKEPHMLFSFTWIILFFLLKKYNEEKEKSEENECYEENDVYIAR